MRKSRMMAALVLGIVLVLGFYSLMAVAQDDPHKANKHLSLKVPVQQEATTTLSQKGDGKFLAEKSASPQRTALGAWLLTPVVVIGALLVPWTRSQYHDIKRMIACARNSSYC